MKGIVLAGGSGTRMQPATLSTSKQLLSVYDKPMLYYPLSVLMLAEIRDILIISTPTNLPSIREALSDGSHLGLNITYAIQEKPLGIADAFRVGAHHVGNEDVALILGDNIFHGSGFPRVLREARSDLDGCTLFGYPVSDPERYGIAEIDQDGELVSIIEKPTKPPSNNAITGLYFYTPDVVDIAQEITPSARGELEISDINNIYLKDGRANLIRLGRGYTWIDAGTHDSILSASHYVQVIEKRQGVRIACLEEISMRMGYISKDDCHKLGERLAKSDYGKYLMQIAYSTD